MILLKLLWSFMQIGAFSIGGGMAALPLIQTQVVTLHGWLTLTEFTDLITIAEMTPGPIALNAATFVGIRVAGFPGALIATFGCILPPCIIVSILAWIYFRYRDLKAVQGTLNGLRPAVVALIAAAGLSVFKLAIWGEAPVSFSPAAINFFAVGMFAGALFILRKWKPNPVFVMLGCGVIGGVLYSLL